MRSRRLLRFLFLATLLAFPSTSLVGCAENLPEIVALTPGASDVEVISDVPNSDIYTAVGQVSARVMGVEVSAAVREAKNELRNQAAARSATFVSIDEITSRPSWDLRGHTVVSMVGTAYKAK